MVKGIFLIVIAFAVLMLPLQWICAVCAAMIFHELCHYWAVKLCGGNVRKMTFGFSGARMDVEGLAIWQEALCVLAGPVGSISLVLLHRVFPRLALCASFQAVFNLLPVYPLDGGRLLYCVVLLFGGGPWTGRICSWIEKMVLFALCFLGFYGCFVLRLGWFPLIGALVMVLRAKRPCKVMRLPLQ